MEAKANVTYHKVRDAPTEERPINARDSACPSARDACVSCLVFHMDVLMEDPLLRMRFQPSRGHETSALRRSRVIAHDEEPAERAAPPLKPPPARAGTAAAHQQRAHLRHLRLNGRPRSAHQSSDLEGCK